jgi:hypothetical protein
MGTTIVSCTSEKRAEWRVLVTAGGCTGCAGGCVSPVGGADGEGPEGGSGFFVHHAEPGGREVKNMSVRECIVHVAFVVARDVRSRPYLQPSAVV